MKPHELFVIEHCESSQRVGVYAFVPHVIAGESLGGEFLIRTSDGWDFRPVEEFVPYSPHKLELDNEEEG